MTVKDLSFSMRRAGWFESGWSGNIAIGEVKALRYFSQAYDDRPLLARHDVTALTALRRWQKGFYDLPPVAADQE